MSTPENTFITSVHRYIPDDVYWMKNHNQYNGGIADVWYSGRKADMWIEYKFINVPKRPETVIPLATEKSPMLSHLQQDWLKGRLLEGRNIAVIIGSKEGGVWMPNLAWSIPLNTAAFKSQMLTRAELASKILECVQ